MVTLTPGSGKPLQMLKKGSQFAPGFNGWLMSSASADYKEHPALSVYISPKLPLMPATHYTIQITATSRKGAMLTAEEGCWSFTTEDLLEIQPVKFSLNIRAKAIYWHGGFFQGFPAFSL